DGELGERGELATALAAVEAGVGTRGGSQDHTAILCCQPGLWSRFRFRPMRSEGTLPEPAELALLVAVSGVVASKSGAARAAFNRAADAVGDILALWNRATSRQDASLAAALASAPGAREELRSLLVPQPRLAARLEQFWNESEVWIPAAVAAAAAQDWRAFAEVVACSQAAAAAALGNQTPETDALVALALGLGAVAASSFGAGFGGSVWALVPRAEAQAFRSAWQQQYRRQFPGCAARSQFMECAAGPPATKLAWGQGTDE
ncbi:MAG: hypothetical protein ACRD1Y_08700, partial [Terriglobales bacterium]